tara:strand:+ start:212 stop:463 length:252 start_codon:yes stop_codon:yes gene_type:complete
MTRKQAVEKFGNIDELELSDRTHRFLKRVLGCEHIKDVVDFYNGMGRFNMRYVLYLVTNSSFKFRGTNDCVWRELGDELKWCI